MGDWETEETSDSWGWQACTEAEVMVHWVPGTHVTMIAQPQVQVLAEQLTQFIQ